MRQMRASQTRPLNQMTAPHCPSCINAKQQGETLVCLKFGVRATPRTSQDCTDFFQREPGSDDAEMVWYAGAWHVSGEGRGD